MLILKRFALAIYLSCTSIYFCSYVTISRSVEDDHQRCLSDPAHDRRWADFNQTESDPTVLLYIHVHVYTRGPNSSVPYYGLIPTSGIMI